MPGVIWVSSVFARGVVVITTSRLTVESSSSVRDRLQGKHCDITWYLAFIRKIMRRRWFRARKCKYVYIVISDLSFFIVCKRWYNPSCIICFFTLSNFNNKCHLSFWINRNKNVLFVVVLMKWMLFYYVILTSENFQYPFYSLLYYMP